MTPSQLARLRAQADDIRERHKEDAWGHFAPGGATDHGHGYFAAHADRGTLLYLLEQTQAAYERAEKVARAADWYVNNGVDLAPLRDALAEWRDGQEKA